MSTRRSYIPALAASLAMALSVAVADEQTDTGPSMMMKHHEFNLEKQVENAKTAADHERLAKRFEDDAARYEAKAAEHERLAKQYAQGVGVAPKNSAANLENHCQSIAKNFHALAQDAREIAQIHRDVAKGLSK